MPTFASFQSGLNSSKYDQSGFYAATNLDIHSQIGTAQPQKGTVMDSITVNEPAVQATAEDGSVFFFSTTTGKTWKRTTAGGYSLVNTNANGAHISAFYSQTLKKIVYTTATKVGHAVASTNTFTDSFGTLTSSAYHPITEVNLTVFIGNAKDVASINVALGFNASALDLPTQCSVTCLTPDRNWLLIGTMIGGNVSKATAYLWDTYSSSWTQEDDVYEVGINMFVTTDSMIYAQCGTNGNFYYWNGQSLVYYDTLEIATTVAPQNVAVLNGKPLFAIGTGIYSLYKRNRNSNDVLCHEFTTTSGNVTSLGVTSTQLMIPNSLGVNKIDTSYATATVTTPLFFFGNEKTVEVPYESVPTGCYLLCESNINNSGWVTEEFLNDVTNMKYYVEGGLSFNGKMKFGQIRITLTPSTSYFPIIQGISIL